MNRFLDYFLWISKKDSKAQGVSLQGDFVVKWLFFHQFILLVKPKLFVIKFIVVKVIFMYHVLFWLSELMSDPWI